MRSRTAALIATALVAATVTSSACSPSRHASRCSTPFLGDPQATPAMSFLALSSAGSFVAVQDSGAAPLLAAPQGGFVLFAGIRATNIDPCNIQITGALRDPTTNKVIGLDSRPVSLAADGSTGFGVPADPTGLENYSNIPACPSAAATRGIVGTSYALEISLQDQRGHTAAGLVHVVPYCPQSEMSYCLAYCSVSTAGAVAVNGG